MNQAMPLGPVSAYVRERLARLLDERRVVVWYDPEQAFGELVARLGLENGAVVTVGESALRARREAEVAYRGLEEADGGAGSECGIGGDGGMSRSCGARVRDGSAERMKDQALRNAVVST